VKAFDGALSPTPHYYEIMGRAAEIAHALGSPAGGAEHLFLGILHDGGWPLGAIAGELIGELQALTDAIGIPVPAYGPLFVAAWRGREAEASAAISTAIQEFTSTGEGAVLAFADYARVLCNGADTFRARSCRWCPAS
jgi:hypothetical protein